ncbi:hypothetical protein Q8F55_008197 [Vanrija albida]|uniref:Uncharacterized protein n=1 Tax=Vanrija albida TaxID=181172 RepID=A0ABR3PVL0_9TREE
MPVFKSPTRSALHLGPVHFAPASTLLALSIEVPGADSPKRRIMASAAQVRSTLDAFPGPKGDQYPVRVILKYTDIKDWKRRDRDHVVRKLVALERQMPEYAAAFAVVRWMKGYGPSEVLAMEWPPSLDVGRSARGPSGRLLSGTSYTTGTERATTKGRRRVLKAAVPSGRLSWYYALSEVEGS